MSFEKAAAYLEKCGLKEKILTFEKSSATVELAAEAVGCEPARIAKTMSFLQGEKAVLIVTAGDARVDNKKYKEKFGKKAKMISGEMVEGYIGHAPGGVCPFGIKEGVEVYLDVSLKRFETVYPAAGSGSSAVGLTIPELEQASRSLGCIDVCKLGTG